MSLSDSIGTSYLPPSKYGTAGIDYPFSYTSISDFKQNNWTISSAMKTNYNDTTRTIPKINYTFEYLDNTKVIFNTSLLRTVHGETCMIGGWYVMAALVSDKTETSDTTLSDWSDRLDNTYAAIYYSKDGLNWNYGGKILQQAALINPLVWDFSLVMREGSQNTVDMFYTSAISGGTYMEFCHSSGTIVANINGVALNGFTSSEVMMITDGIIYADQQQNDTFRFMAPYPFLNPGDGEIYCLFYAKIGGMVTSFTITEKESGIIPPGYVVGNNAVDGNACLGIMKYNGDYTSFSQSNWTLMNPLISMLGVTDEFSRPQIFFDKTYTYIFGSISSSSFSGNIYSPTGLYGFVSKTGLFGKFEPMNGSGYIAGNPTSSPSQSSSFYVTSDYNIFSTIELLPKDGPQDPNNPKTYRIGGTPAPTITLSITDDETFVESVLNFGQTKSSYIDWNTIYTTYGGNSAPWIRS